MKTPKTNTKRTDKDIFTNPIVLAATFGTTLTLAFASVIALLSTSGTVIAKHNGKIYIDRNKDNLVDNVVDFGKDTTHLVYKSALPGDRFKYTTRTFDDSYSCEINARDVEWFWVNNHNKNELQLNLIREQIAHTK